ncbi:hypothetical protein GCM10010271_73250 [Streptomyces kurssanovii]|nr:hypothetical protein GCM10010271_73250 [Streptomyces kurssanovii]
MPVDSFFARGTLDADDTSYSLYRLDALPGSQRLPYSLKVLLENLLRHEDGGTSPPTRSRRWPVGTRRRNRRPRCSSPPRGC